MEAESWAKLGILGGGRLELCRAVGWGAVVVGWVDMVVAAVPDARALSIRNLDQRLHPAMLPLCQWMVPRSLYPPVTHGDSCSCSATLGIMQGSASQDGPHEQVVHTTTCRPTPQPLSSSFRNMLKANQTVLYA